MECFFCRLCEQFARQRQRVLKKTPQQQRSTRCLEKAAGYIEFVSSFSTFVCLREATYNFNTNLPGPYNRLPAGKLVAGPCNFVAEQYKLEAETTRVWDSHLAKSEGCPSTPHEHMASCAGFRIRVWSSAIVCLSGHDDIRFPRRDVMLPCVPVDGTGNTATGCPL